MLWLNVLMINDDMVAVASGIIVLTLACCLASPVRYPFMIYNGLLVLVHIIGEWVMAHSMVRPILNVLIDKITHTHTQ